MAPQAELLRRKEPAPKPKLPYKINLEGTNLHEIDILGLPLNVRANLLARGANTLDAAFIFASNPAMHTEEL